MENLLASFEEHYVVLSYDYRGHIHITCYSSIYGQICESQWEQFRIVAFMSIRVSSANVARAVQTVFLKRHCITQENASSIPLSFETKFDEESRDKAVSALKGIVGSLEKDLTFTNQVKMLGMTSQIKKVDFQKIYEGLRETMKSRNPDAMDVAQPKRKRAEDDLEGPATKKQRVDDYETELTSIFKKAIDSRDRLRTLLWSVYGFGSDEAETCMKIIDEPFYQV